MEDLTTIDAVHGYGAVIRAFVDLVARSIMHGSDYNYQRYA